MNKFDIPYLFAIKIQDKTQEDLDAITDWIKKADTAGVTRPAIVNTLAGSGWPGPFVRWYVEKILPPSTDPNP